MPAGWTVAAVLAHIGFWDARAIFFLDRWGRGIEPSTADYDPADVHWINDSAKPLCLALPPRDAADLALRLADGSRMRPPAERRIRVQVADAPSARDVIFSGKPIEVTL